MFPLLSRTALAVVLCAVPAIASAQADPPATPIAPSVSEASIPPIAAPAPIKLPALAAVDLIMLEEVSSKTAVTGAPVKLALARPLYFSSELGLPAGTPVEGVVIHAAKGGMGGKAGELLLGARHIRISEGISIPLRSFKLAPAKGQNNEGVAFAASVAGGAIGATAALFIKGGSAAIPANMTATAKTSTEVEIPVALLSNLPSISSAQAQLIPAVAPATTTQSTQTNQPTATQGETK